MSGRTIPETANRQDWPRLVAQGHKDHESRVSALEGQFSALGDYVDDTAAATAGVAVGGLYRTGSVVKVRVS